MLMIFLGELSSDDKGLTKSQYHNEKPGLLNERDMAGNIRAC